MELKTNKLPNKQNFFYRYYRIIVIPLVFFVYLSSYFMLNPFQKDDIYSFLFSSKWVDLVLLLAYCWVLTEISLLVGRRLNTWISWEQNPVFRAFVQFVFIILGNIFVNYLFSYLWHYFYPMDVLEESEVLLIWQSNLMAAILSLFISFIHTGIFLLNRWRLTSEEAAELKIKASQFQEQATRSELESLKLQLDPHFIFNNFSTLTELIHEDQQSASAFLENITRVYRYMISNMSRDTITLKEEIDFLNAYFYLLNKRLEGKIALVTDINEAHLDLHLPPLTLQLLVENAIKHNMATASSPLKIFIYSQGNDLLVKNILQPTTGKTLVSTGIGNKNIEFRYKILFDKVPVFYESEGYYYVRLPLV